MMQKRSTTLPPWPCPPVPFLRRRRINLRHSAVEKAKTDSKHSIGPLKQNGLYRYTTIFWFEKLKSEQDVKANAPQQRVEASWVQTLRSEWFDAGAVFKLPVTVTWSVATCKRRRLNSLLVSCETAFSLWQWTGTRSAAPRAPIRLLTPCGSWGFRMRTLSKEVRSSCNYCTRWKQPTSRCRNTV